MICNSPPRAKRTDHSSLLFPLSLANSSQDPSKSPLESLWGFSISLEPPYFSRPLVFPPSRPRAFPLSSKVVSVSDSIPDYAAEIPRTPYANALETHVGQDHINRLTQVFIDIGVAHWLEEHPFSRLELTHAVMYRGQNVNGLYDFLQRTLKIATTRDSSEYGQTFEWQRAYSVSSTGKTPTETVQMTLVHELGHHIHNILGQTHRAYFNETLAMVFLQGGTTYAQKDHLEYFAESFALYVFYPTELLVKDPNGYGMIEKTLRLVGLEVKQP